MNKSICISIALCLFSALFFSCNQDDKKNLQENVVLDSQTEDDKTENQETWKIKPQNICIFFGNSFDENARKDIIYQTQESFTGTGINLFSFPNNLNKKASELTDFVNEHKIDGLLVLSAPEITKELRKVTASREKPEEKTSEKQNENTETVSENDFNQVDGDIYKPIKIFSIALADNKDSTETENVSNLVISISKTVEKQSDETEETENTETIEEKVEYKFEASDFADIIISLIKYMPDFEQESPSKLRNKIVYYFKSNWDIDFFVDEETDIRSANHFILTKKEL